ncbi:MAG TPA: Crp/Fnr family transcriptional regulator, partial [Bacteroidetes bacterium]|nr:Crp/Fnr family transcriptional regulator [Bacteroidota bacterium]HEX04208.1 Crp/Fnr family transcriptional regulator [Bacteroidota bacterium]
MDTTGKASNLEPEGRNPEVAGDSRPELSVSLNRQRAQSTLRMDVPGFETMRLVSPTRNDVVEKSEQPSSSTLLPLLSPPNCGSLRSDMIARFASSKKPNPLLDTLSPVGQKALKEVMEEFEFQAGEELELDSSEIAGLYFIQEGSVEIEHVFPERTPHQCDSRGSGEFFGEQVVLDGSRRMILRIFENTKGIWIPENRFALLIEAEPAFLLNLTRLVIRHQSEYDDRLIDKLYEANRTSEQ